MSAHPQLPISHQHPVAFFCAEFGLLSHIPTYAGGLGVLAGDILKQAADQHIPMVGIGLLYRGEGAIQHIANDGSQVEVDLNYDPLTAGLEHVYADDVPMFIKVHLSELDVWVRCWKKSLSDEVTLYLLDTDTDQNHPSQRQICRALYAGTEEELVKQQLILGIGGIKLLRGLGIQPSLYHVNEGRPAFLHWQLIRQKMDQQGMTYEAAAKKAKSMTVYTNHTLVEAGNQSYTAHLLKAYGMYYAGKMGISIDQLLEPGLLDEDRFSITQYALHTSHKATAVSQLHLKFCQAQWPENNWVGITNGVHLPTWQDSQLSSNQLSDEEIWQRHTELKQQTMEYVRRRTGFGYDPNALVMTWSRRIAGYKQALTLFSDLPRLLSLLKQAGRPVQILIAGKAHVYDKQGKQTIQEIIKAMQTTLSGSALYIPNLDIELDAALTRGSDIWLNTPEFGKEACGTSGMKAAANGVLNVTVGDGWAAEVDWSNKGWLLDHNQLAENLFTSLETKVVPTFYTRNEKNIPLAWVKMMRGALSLAESYSAQRMMHQYRELVYESD